MNFQFIEGKTCQWGDVLTKGFTKKRTICQKDVMPEVQFAIKWGGLRIIGRKDYLSKGPLAKGTRTLGLKDNLPQNNLSIGPFAVKFLSSNTFSNFTLRPWNITWINSKLHNFIFHQLKPVFSLEAVEN